MSDLTPETLLRAYAAGLFPMADNADSDGVGWYDPPVRGILPLENFHTPRSLAKLYRKQPFTLTVDKDFEAVIRLCAESTTDRPSTWINDEIIKAYSALHRIGHANSVEAWDGDQLVGGLYGVSLGSAFFGESMVSLRPNASRLCLVHLVGLMREAGFQLLDTQFSNDHLLQFGCVEISRTQYHGRLQRALTAGRHRLPGALEDQTYSVG